MLAARGEGPAAFDRRCIPKLPALGHFLQGSNTAGMLPRRALPSGRITGLGATLDFHHGLLGMCGAELLECIGRRERFGAAWGDPLDLFPRLDGPLEILFPEGPDDTQAQDRLGVRRVHFQ